MDPDEAPPPHNLRITYYNDLMTGQLQLNIDYISPPNTRPERHDALHWKHISKILGGLGELALSGGLSVRVTQDNVESIYAVRRETVNAEWQIVPVSSQRIPETPGEPPPWPNLPGSVTVKNQELNPS